MVATVEAFQNENEEFRDIIMKLEVAYQNFSEKLAPILHRGRYPSLPSSDSGRKRRHSMSLVF